MRRFVIATGIFLAAVLLLSLSGLFQIYRFLAGAHVAWGFYVTLGPPASILKGIAFLILLATLSYWLSGKLVKSRA
ncbi:MAG TPA: hypothetical protein VKE93_13630 [Candidatus Angelobacter sp.]|nr:hypothetical protein [Candidatus Angelobacter sp.]